MLSDLTFPSSGPPSLIKREPVFLGTGTRLNVTYFLLFSLSSLSTDPRAAAPVQKLEDCVRPPPDLPVGGLSSPEVGPRTARKTKRARLSSSSTDGSSEVGSPLGHSTPASSHKRLGRAASDRPKPAAAKRFKFKAGVAGAWGPSSSDLTAMQGMLDASPPTDPGRYAPRPLSNTSPQLFAPPKLKSHLSPTAPVQRKGSEPRLQRQRGTPDPSRWAGGPLL